MQNKDTTSSARLLSRKSIEITNFRESSSGKYAVPFLSQSLNYQIKRLVPISNPDIARVRPPAPTATAPLAPTITSGTSGNTEVFIAFTAGSDGGSSITNYKYSIDDGATFTAFSPATTTSPVTITGLTNGTTYDIQLKAVNAVGDGTASSSFSITPVPGGSTTFSGAGLQLLLDGTNATNSSVWPDTSGKLKSATLTGSPSLSSGVYTFTGTQYGTVPSGFNNFTSGITILAFINFGIGNDWERIIDFGTGQQSNNIILARNSSTTTLQFQNYSGTVLNVDVSLLNGITNSQWMFSAARLNGTNYLLQNESTSTTGSNINLPANITRTSNYIGMSNWNNPLFEGEMGLIAIYNKALTDAEIISFYN
jgi:hypothetical protein